MKITDLLNLKRRYLENSYTAYQNAKNFANEFCLTLHAYQVSLLACTPTFCVGLRQIQALNFFLFSVCIEKC